MIDELSGDFLQWLRGFYYVAKKGSVSLSALEGNENTSHQRQERFFGVLNRISNLRNEPLNTRIT